MTESLTSRERDALRIMLTNARIRHWSDSRIAESLWGKKAWLERAPEGAEILKSLAAKLPFIKQRANCHHYEVDYMFLYKFWLERQPEAESEYVDQLKYANMIP